MKRRAFGFVVVVLVAIVAAAIVVRDDSPAASRRRPLEGGEFMVFMQVQATDEQIADVRRVLKAAPLITRYRYISQEAALRTVRHYELRSNSGIVGTITAADLPASFDAHTRTRRDARKLAPRLRRLPGVDESQIAPSTRQIRHTCKQLKKAFRNPPQRLKRSCGRYW